VLKELLDNALDACEDKNIPPTVTVTVGRDGISVADNGPGLPSEVVDGVIDFNVRVSSREAYVAPDRGAQGNALKALVAMPFVLDGDRGRVDIESRGVRHQITMWTDRIRQMPVLDPDRVPVPALPGTKIRVDWPDAASSLLQDARSQFLQIAEDYTFLNPHLTLTVDWFGESSHIPASNPCWKKWLPSDPTSPHWYGPEHFERLVAAYIAHDMDTGRKRTVREMVAEFGGLSGTAKQKAVLEEAGVSRTLLADLAPGGELDSELVGKLLVAMQRYGKPVKPLTLGPLGQDHLLARFQELGCQPESFKYRQFPGTKDGVPRVLEAAFAWCPELPERRLVSGVNWSPGIINPFRELGRTGKSLDAVLEEQRCGVDEPVCLLVHLISPRVEYTDRGKSAVVITD
jgi:DNA topoisomerase VI subunit B